MDDERHAQLGLFLSASFHQNVRDVTRQLAHLQVSKQASKQHKTNEIKISTLWSIMETQIEF